MVELPGEEMCPIQRDDTVAVLGYTAGQVTAATHHCVTRVPTLPLSAYSAYSA